MSAKLDFGFATSLPTALPGDNNNDGTAISPPEDLGTDGSVSSNRVQPCTPRFNSKNTYILTPDHTPSPPPLSLNDPTTPSTDPTSERLFPSFGNFSLPDPFSSTSPPITRPSKLDTSPDTPILRRDRYDLNSTRSPSHLHHRNLNLESKYLRTHYQDLQFYRKWTSHLISLLTGIPIMRNLTSTSLENFITTTSPSRTESLIKSDDSHSFPPRTDYANELTILTRQKKLLRENHLAISISELEALITRLTTLPFPSPNTLQDKKNDTDTLLYRVHTAESKSTYSRSYGFRCSGWIDSLYTSGVKNERQADGRAFQAHCHATPDPSPYISVSTSVARLMRLRQCKKENEVRSRVFVISLNRLRQLGIKAQSTDSYLEEFKKIWGNDQKVEFATKTHWLVEEWIPDQAIVSEMDCVEFLKIAQREGINREVAWTPTFISELETRKIDLEKWPKRDV